MRFIDSNVLVYVADDTDAAKQKAAREIVKCALSSDEYVISAQVINEFSFVLLRKLHKTADEIDGFVEILDGIKTVSVLPEWTRKAIAIMKRYELQFFDSLLLAAAVDLGCDEFLSEDLNDGQFYNGVKAVNPFNQISS